MIPESFLCFNSLIAKSLAETVVRSKTLRTKNVEAASIVEPLQNRRVDHDAAIVRRFPRDLAFSLSVELPVIQFLITVPVVYLHTQ